jgi:predicted flap endonuclease-1-like 5' DNA nuclease
MKRILGFLVGAGLGVFIAYLLRRFLSRSTATPAPVEIPAPKNSTVIDPSQSNEKVTTKFTVRRTGPRPQATATDAATSTASADGHPTSVDSKKEVEQTLQEAIPAATVVEETASVVEETLVESSTTDSTQDDFTILDDIGPIFNTKLHNAGVHTFAELAALSSEDIAEKVGTNAARVERFQWREQAALLASGSSDTPAEETKTEG